MFSSRRIAWLAPRFTAASDLSAKPTPKALDLHQLFSWMLADGMIDDRHDQLMEPSDKALPGALKWMLRDQRDYESLAPLQVIFAGEIPTLLPGAVIRPLFLRLRDNDPDVADPRLFLPLNVHASNGVLHTVDRVLLPVDLP